MAVGRSCSCVHACCRWPLLPLNDFCLIRTGLAAAEAENKHWMNCLTVAGTRHLGSCSLELSSKCGRPESIPWTWTRNSPVAKRIDSGDLCCQLGARCSTRGPNRAAREHQWSPGERNRSGSQPDVPPRSGPHARVEGGALSVRRKMGWDEVLLTVASDVVSSSPSTEPKLLRIVPRLTPRSPQAPANHVIDYSSAG